MKKQRLLFFTGAGISSESGIPTFGEQEGLRDKLSRDYVLRYTNEYRETIKQMKEVCDKAEPNEAHKAIATMNYPVITMNIDGLHQRAGSKKVIDIHGRLPEEHELYADNFKYLLNIPVLYGDPAPKYQIARNLVDDLDYDNSFFVVIGTSFYTSISEELVKKARQKKAEVIIINDNAVERVPKIIKYLNEKLK